MTKGLSVVMLGATGAVGAQVVQHLLTNHDLSRLTLLGRRQIDDLADVRVQQHTVDVFNPSTYEMLLPNHDIAICTFGVGEPTKVSKDELVRVDKTAVLAFAMVCRAAGVKHFELLGSVGASARSLSFFLRTKGELEDGLRALEFERLSIFRPSMILTPTNRYGVSQALTLAVWPRFNPILQGGLRKYRGIPIERLGRAIANNIKTQNSGTEILHWDQVMASSVDER